MNFAFFLCHNLNESQVTALNIIELKINCKGNYLRHWAGSQPAFHGAHSIRFRNMALAGMTFF